MRNGERIAEEVAPANTRGVLGWPHTKVVETAVEEVAFAEPGEAFGWVKDGGYCSLCQLWSTVAVDASPAALAAEKVRTLLCCLTDVFLAEQPAIKRRIGCHQGRLVKLDRKPEEEREI